ncbi:hypothetical protein Egran_02551 [Elaphomyces granulatus]|uniref:NAD(+) diphosphatase n=1 Tax=Elaphomyces granulatus TaxID=519963 RepID=A0A232LZZ7_9EURO|nr:hypothetical protein Egran_02551 [Elaphomyces granulatus]
MMSLYNSQIPTPVHIQEESMLSRRFGRETANYFSSSSLNRLSFLRTHHSFLSAALQHRSTRFLLLNQLAPLTKSPSELFYVQYSDVQNLVPVDYFEKPEEDLIKDYDSRVTTPQLVFLGLDETSNNGDKLTWKAYTGVPYFALDVTPKGSHEQETSITEVTEAMRMKGLDFLMTRVINTLPAEQAAIYAQARALIDWNTRNTFCGTCGHTTISINAGSKRTCPPTDAALLAQGKSLERPPCSTRMTVSNLSFPRTDPTVIVAVLSADGQRLLLGRGKRFPPLWYSTLAGFVEPAESVEDAVRREVWEEAGVILSRVVIHSSQPWPYPANLMIGAIAQVSDPVHEAISLEHDPELQDARWFPISEVEEALRVGTSGLSEPPGPEYSEGNLRLPPPTAIANQLIQAAISQNYIISDKSAKI